MSILYMFTHLALNETVSDYLIASGPFVVDSTVSSKERADRVSAVEAISSFTLGTRRKVYALFHEGSKDPTFIAHQVNVIAGLTDAAGQWNYDLTVTPTGTSFNNATTYAALETIFTSCAATPSTCPAALITSYLDQQFVDRAATLAAGAVNPIPYFVIGSSGATDANANAHVAQYIGVDDGQVGMQAAQMMIEAGATKPLCVGPSAAGPSYARRCAGFVSTYSSVKGVTAAELYTPTSLENAQALLKSKMQGTVYDGILCTMPELCTSLFAMLDTTPTIARPKYVYSIGMSVSVMEAITQGKMLGAVDTTPYTNGYIAMYHVGSLLEGSTIPSTQVVHIGQKNRTWACPPGYAFNADGNMYTRMPSGMMSAGSVCQPCPANSHAPAASTAICSACPLGTYADRTGAIRCASCDDGIGITVGYCANYFKGTEVTPSSRSAVRALGGIGLAVVGLLGAGLVVAQGEPIIRKASPALSSGVLVGSMFVVASTLLQQFDLSTGKCTSSMWLLATGFGLSVGCVFVKNLRVYRIFNNPRLRSQGLNFTYMAQQLAFILLGEWILLAIWTGVSAPTKLLTTSGSGKTYAACSSPKLAVQGAFSGLLILYNAALLIANVCIGFLNRNLQEDFSETQYISWASYNILVCSALAIAIGYLDIDIDFKWGVLFAMIILAAVGLPIILFATRLVRAYTDRKNASGDTGSEITSQPKSATGQKMMSFRKGSLNKGSGNIRPNTLNAMLTQNIPVAVHRGKMMSVWESYKATLIIIPRGAGVIIILTGSDTKESSEALTVGPGAFTPLMNPEAAADFMLFVVAANGRRTVSIQLEDAETYATWEAHFKAVARKKAQDTNTMPMSNGSGGATSGGREDDFV
ncbi:7 transmembrane sweet-taste receptor of 3 GCPR-domain-containing protein [Fimicolochytrium jonesii]|uniref:7 transmembrane sweet-taste receptor of 3 GCPR-domain-containing protein n=1 Tax=Fimicolochytrium jonesii TaxID=1396493 RepID=UPI0022FECA41|nr:7 transmembrane sweet-taste receptor of 3 GCPR-domain-containing protein [Fimicolochytrium jonesii]KAI8823001.1 7 transmembrane sweet-taste receptor of 3 GCPR-domain-containing protein [Fimicolochytrium jonesii]